jgi:predicted dehydrogenase
MMKPVTMGVVGCGKISGIYFENAAKLADFTKVVACADLMPERAKAAAEKYGIPKACSVKKLLADPEIELVLNLTVPKAHAKVNLAAIKAGKSVYVEKPLAATRRDARRTLDAAAKAGVLVGAAPDTFLGAGIQTCRKLIDDGAIGTPVAATAFMLCRGHESWHPDPEFYYELGGGPMLDMGPYYLTCLVNLLGPIARATGSARASFPTRTITSQPKAGKVITVQTPTHLSAVLDFAGGAVGTVLMSFDVAAHNLPRIEVYGSEGSIAVPDPNGFRGPVMLRKRGEKEWTEVPLTHPYAENWRGLGPADLAVALRTGRKHRASGLLACHILDAMLAVGEASAKGRHIRLQTTCERPAAMPTTLKEGELD